MNGKIARVAFVILLVGIAFSMVGCGDGAVGCGDGTSMDREDDEEKYVARFVSVDGREFVVPRCYLGSSSKSAKKLFEESKIPREKLQSVEIFWGVDEIEAGAFAGCTSLKSVKIHTGVKEIGYGAFTGCTSLETLKIPVSVEKIPESGEIVGDDRMPVTDYGDDEEKYVARFVSVNGTEYVSTRCEWGKKGRSGRIASAKQLFELSKIPRQMLRSVEMFWGVHNIEEGAFAGCTSLKSVKMPLSVGEIGKGAFAGCASLENVMIPLSVSEIGMGAFHRCSALKFVRIPQRGEMSCIKAKAFAGCTSLKFVNIPLHVWEIGKAAFSGCISLKAVSISSPEEGCFGVRIGESAFSGCASLESLKMPEHVAGIGCRAFSGCTSLRSVRIPLFSDPLFRDNSFRVFSGCTSLATVEIPKGVIKIEGDTFAECAALKDIKVDEGNAHYKIIDGNLLNMDGTLFIRARSDAVAVTIPEGVRTIDSCAFSGCKSLKAVAFPSTVTKIWFSAFEGCAALENVKIPLAVTEIDSRTFQGCTSLESVEIPSGVKEICADAFAGCESLENIKVAEENTNYKVVDGNLLSKDGTVFVYAKGRASTVTIPESVEKFANGAFAGCVALEEFKVADGNANYKSADGNVLSKDGTVFVCAKRSASSVTIPDGVEKISGASFCWCASLKTIKVAEENTNYKSVDGNLLSKDGTVFVCANRCASSVKIPEGVGKIADAAFYENRFLESVNFPSSLREIGDAAFWGCESLKSADIPSRVTKIGKSVFGGCRSLESVNLSVGIEEIGAGTFLGCESLKSVMFPPNVRRIGECAFSGCTALGFVNMPLCVKKIGEEAFSGCDLSYVIIPKGAGYIDVGKNAFPEETLIIKE